MNIKCQLDHSYRPRGPADAQRAKEYWRWRSDLLLRTFGLSSFRR